MSASQTPVSIALISVIAKQLDRNQAILTQTHPDNALLRTLVAEKVTLTDQPEILNSPRLISQLQILMLAALSMYGGVMVPYINNVSIRDQTIRITWDTGMVDAFTFGIHDEKFTLFSKYFQSRLSKKAPHSNAIPSKILSGIDQFLQTYLMVLNAVKDRLTPLLKGKQQLINLIQADLNNDLLFIIISSLPAEQMNSLFLYVQQFLPEDLEVKTTKGNKVKVCSLFQTPSTDVIFLIEKTKIYLDLYFSGNWPIITEITQGKTKDYLQKALTNQALYEKTLEKITHLVRLQIGARIDLYKTLRAYLGFILK